MFLPLAWPIHLRVLGFRARVLGFREFPESMDPFVEV